MARHSERYEADIEGFDIAGGGGAESKVFVFEARDGNKGESPGLSPRSDCGPDAQGGKERHARRHLARTGHPLDFWGTGGKSIDSLSVQKQEHADTKITVFPVAEQDRQARDTDHYALVFDSGFSSHSAADLTEFASSWPETWQAGHFAASFSGHSSWDETPPGNSAPQKDPQQLGYKEWRESGVCQTRSDAMVYRSDSSTSIPGCVVCGDAAGIPRTMVSEERRRSKEMKKKDESQVVDVEDRCDSGICSVGESASKIFQNQVVSLRSGFSDLRLALSSDRGKDREERYVHSCEDVGVTSQNYTACPESENQNTEHFHESLFERIQAVSSNEENGSRNTKWDRRDETVIPGSKTETKSDRDCRESAESCPLDADTKRREKITETIAGPACLHAGSGRQHEGSDVTREVRRPQAAKEPTHPEFQGRKQTPECVQRTERSRVPGSGTPKFIAVLMGIRDEDGDTFLHNGIVHGQAELVVSVLHQLPWHPPYQAVTQEFLDASNHLSQTALHLAVVTSQYDVIKALVLAGASLEGRDLQGNTPLHVACGRGNLLAALMLVSPATREEKAGGEEGRSGAMTTQRGIHRNLQLRNYEGFTCLHLAVQGYDSALALLLLVIGADVNACDAKSGRTALHHAADSGDTRLVQVLLKRPDIDVNRPSFSGHTPLTIAWGRGHTSVVRLLLAAGAQFDDDDYEDDDEDAFDDVDSNVDEWEYLESETSSGWI